MPGSTTILSLLVPDFNQVPWDDDVNTNWFILDAAIGQFFGVANLVGIWKNNVAYTAGQSVVDQDDASMWTCAISHTSAAAPTTFSEDRLNNPGYWTQIVSAAHDYAVQAQAAANSAAGSATAAAVSAADAAASAAVVAGALPLTGGTLTGPLILNADPAAALGAATKQYVDARVGGVGFLETTGGTMTGPIVLPGNPSSANQAANKQYVDLMLPLSGGTLSGNVTSSARITANNFVAVTTMTANAFIASVSGMKMIGDGAASYIYMDTNNWRLVYNRSNNRLTYVRGTDSGGLFFIDGSGNTSAAGSMSGASLLISPTNGGFLGDATYSYIRWDSANWHLRYQRSDGTLRYVRGDNTVLFEINPAGNVSVTGGLFAYNGVFPAAASPNFAIYQSGGFNIVQFDTNYSWALNGSNSDLNWETPSGPGLQFRFRADFALQNFFGPMAGNGAYINTSDRSVKSNIVPITYGTDELRVIEAYSFTRNQGSGDPELGFIAQDIQPHVPEAVVTHPDGLLGIGSDMLMAVLWNAVKQIDARVQTLEGH